eukprot:CAMPEP_0118873802 /NCGR_PEP_ID=MMETSP1163-20130328/15465_1 /TAXON_ID=124430 /ORGANISM="Phaeomonas parva, Strain CCMP2877" /LENGTH=116 /DNA_ID=CAMNT_0006809109 /DNA_START=68 /DNA_END=418 /DNA_ORIENTATION=-
MLCVAEHPTAALPPKPRGTGFTPWHRVAPEARKHPQGVGAPWVGTGYTPCTGVAPGHGSIPGFWGVRHGAPAMHGRCRRGSESSEVRGYEKAPPLSTRLGPSSRCDGSAAIHEGFK